MNETSLVLFIDLKPQTRIDLRSAAKAAIAFADLLEDVGGHFDPSSPPSIDLVSSEPGSQKLKVIISSLTDDPKATIRAAVVSSIVLIIGTTARWGIEQVLEWMSSDDAPEQVLMLSEEDRLAIAQNVVTSLDARVAQRPAIRLYSELASDPNVIGLGVSGTTDSRPLALIPRGDFPPEVFTIEEDGFEKRSRVEEVELVLLRPVLTSETNKRWGFSWPYGKLGATIKDQGFLERLVAGQMNVGMAQGIVFTVKLEITEERRQGVWEAKEYSILHVLHVRPPSEQIGFELP